MDGKHVLVVLVLWLHSYYAPYNTAAIDVSSDPMYYDRSKHIARRDLFIRELVANNVIKPEFIRTEENPADALTKPLPKAAFMKHRNKLLGATI